jgi:hypothetical protein
MRREILSEVNRFREIIGLNLLSEGIVPKSLIDDLANAFARSEDEFFQSLEKKELTSLNKVFDDVAGATGKSSDELIQAFKSNTLDDFAEDLFVAKLIQSGTENLKQAAVKAYSNSKPELVSVIDQAFIGMESAIKKLSKDDYAKNIEDINKIIDDAAMTNEMKTFLKNEYKVNANKIRLKNLGDTPNVKPPTIDLVWSTAQEAAKNKGVSLPSKKYFLDLEDELVKEGMTKKELIRIILEEANDKKSFVDMLVKGRKAGNEIGGAIVDTTEGGLKLTKTALAGWSVGSLLIAGLLAFGFNVAGFQDAVRYGTKSSNWKDIYKENFYNLPEDIQNLITTNYEGRATNDPNNTNGVKSFVYDENNEDSFSVILQDGSVDNWGKVNNNGVISWAKKSKAPSNNTPSGGTGITKQNVIDKITSKDYGYVAPITLTPDEEPKSGVETKYSFLDAESVGGTATVDKDGNITIV